MKMGIKEFRERFSEVVQSGEGVVVTNHGKVVGIFTPLRPKDPKRVDLEAELAAEGIAPDGTPLWRG